MSPEAEESAKPSSPAEEPKQKSSEPSTSAPAAAVSAPAAAPADAPAPLGTPGMFFPSAGAIAKRQVETQRAITATQLPAKGTVAAAPAPTKSAQFGAAKGGGVPERAGAVAAAGADGDTSAERGGEVGTESAVDAAAPVPSASGGPAAAGGHPGSQVTIEVVQRGVVPGRGPVYAIVVDNLSTKDVRYLDFMTKYLYGNRHIPADHVALTLKFAANFLLDAIRRNLHPDEAGANGQ